MEQSRNHSNERSFEGSKSLERIQLEIRQRAIDEFNGVNMEYFNHRTQMHSKIEGLYQEACGFIANQKH